MDWVWSVWGWVWPASFDANKFKVDLKTCIIRLNLHKLKIQELIQKEKSEVLELIRNQKTEMARIKIESMIYHARKISAYETVTHYCEALTSRIELLQTASGDTPSEVLGAIHSLGYASLRLEVSELTEVVQQIKAKFGSNVGDEKVESSAVWIDKKILDSLSLDHPAEDVVNKYLEEYYGIATSSEISSPPLRLLKRTPKSTPEAPENSNQSKPSPIPFNPSPSQVQQTNNYQPYYPSPQFTQASFPNTPTNPSTPSTPTPSIPSTPSSTSDSYPSFSPSTTPSFSPSDTPPFTPSLSKPSTPYTPSTPLYPNPSTPLPTTPIETPSYIDPSLLYHSPYTTYASAPFASPPPENPEYTAHQAATKGSPNTKSGSPHIKKEGSLKKVRTPNIRKIRKSNPFQQGSRKYKQEDMAYNASEDEEDENLLKKKKKTKKEGLSDKELKKLAFEESLKRQDESK